MFPELTSGKLVFTANVLFTIYILEETNCVLTVALSFPVLSILKSSSPDVSEECMSVIERFVVLLYDKTSNLLEVNQARKKLFPKGL